MIGIIMHQGRPVVVQVEIKDGEIVVIVPDGIDTTNLIHAVNIQRAAGMRKVIAQAAMEHKVIQDFNLRGNLPLCKHQSNGISCSKGFIAMANLIRCSDIDNCPWEKCKSFGKPDGMEGGCHYCKDEDPALFERCNSWHQRTLPALPKKREAE